MGDMADFYLDAACDDCEEYDDFMSGRFSLQEAYERGLIDERGAEGRGPKGWNTLFPSPHTLSCKHCGATNVYWHQYPSGKWFLFTQGSNTAHKCKEKE